MAKSLCHVLMKVYHAPVMFFFYITNMSLMQFTENNTAFGPVYEILILITYRASDFFQDWWAEVTHGAKNGGSFSEMMGPSISNSPQLIFGLYTLPTH